MKSIVARIFLPFMLLSLPLFLQGQPPCTEFIEAEGSTILCPGDTACLRVTAHCCGDYFWREISSNTVLATNTDLKVTQPGIYVAVLASGCGETEVFVWDEAFIHTLSDWVHPICPGNSAWFSFPIRDFELRWDDGFVGNSRVFTEPGDYRYSVDTDCGLIEAMLTVEAHPLPDFGLRPDYEICPGELLLLAPNTLDLQEFFWLDGTIGESRTVTEAGTYDFRMRTQENCLVFGNVVVEYSPNCRCEVIVPNVVTPNDDGFNDRFRPQINCQISEWRLRVFDRWGRMRFTTENPDAAWHPEGVPDGVYYWTLEFRGQQAADRKFERRAGNLTVIR